MPPRKLTPEVVVSAALALADARGLDALTMRAIARELGVEAMSLYHHFANKDALLDATVDRVYGEIVLPAEGGDWREEIRRRSVSVRSVLRQHPWALPLMESRRTPGPANLAYHEANIACLRAAGFAPRQVAHAYAVVDAFVYGFVLQELTLPFDSGSEAAAMIGEEPGWAGVGEWSNMAWFVENVVLEPEYSFDREFEPGLTLVLDGIEAMLARA
ncbi:MAG: TetR/AcrR family transcriptional regulator [Actinobacteria bacterium]|jgi:transcriptional regulator, TetR family|nr:TetR/AcrR family transcriptional regulator [Actinomycetota bacterium]